MQVGWDMVVVHIPSGAAANKTLTSITHGMVGT